MGEIDDQIADLETRAVEMRSLTALDSEAAFRAARAILLAARQLIASIDALKAAVMRIEAKLP